MDSRRTLHALRRSLAQQLSLTLADVACRLPRTVPSRPLTVMGLSFPSH